MVLEADDDDGPGQTMRTLTVLSGVFDIVPLFFERVVGAGWRGPAADSRGGCAVVRARAAVVAPGHCAHGAVHNVV